MTRIAGILVAIAIAVAASTVATAQQNTAAIEKLMASAQHKADIDGDLKGAIELYRRVAAAGHRALAARALLSMAAAHQKLRDGATAQQIYERVVRDYADQKEAAASARVRLAPGPALVWANTAVDTYGNGSISRDGRLLAYVDWNTGNLAIRTLADGTTRLLTDGGDFTTSPGTYAGLSVFSPDANRVAFAWFSRERGRYQLRVSPLTPGAAPADALLYENEDVSWIQPYDWSPDGRSLVVQMERTDGTGQIALFDMQTRNMSLLKSVPWQQSSTRVQFSPDGRFVAFDLYGPQHQRDIYVLATDGSRETDVVIDPADDEIVGWSADGSQLLFFSNRKGAWSLWAVDMKDGNASGTPRVIHQDVGVSGRVATLGLTGAGALVYASSRPESSGIRTAPLDAAAGRLLSTPRDPGVELSSTNEVYTFAWSRDSRSLGVFRRVRAGMVDTYRLTIKNMETGAVREIRPQEGNCALWLNWSSDGRSVVCVGRFSGRGTGSRQDRNGVIRVEVSTGQVSYVTDGRAVALGTAGQMYVLRDEQSEGQRRTRLVERSSTGVERELASRANMGRLRLSPDGRLLAAASRDPETGEDSILLVPVSGEEPRVLMTVPRDQAVDVAFWSPDSRSLIARRSRSNGHAYLRVTIDGMVSNADTLQLPGSKHAATVEVSPDGRRVAYAVPREETTAVYRLDGLAR
jgi:dipeptidyl aminopeptidase/acylaminoacyl peptidase